MKIKIPDVTLRRETEHLFQELITQYFNEFRFNSAQEASEKMFSDFQDILKSFVKHARSNLQVMTEEEKSQYVPVDLLPVNQQLEQGCEELKQKIKSKAEHIKLLRAETISKMKTELQTKQHYVEKELPDWSKALEKLSTTQTKPQIETIQIISAANLESKLKTILRNTKELSETLPKTNKNLENMEQALETLFENDKIAQKQKQVQQVKNSRQKLSSSQSEKPSSSQQSSSQPHESSSQETKGRKSSLRTKRKDLPPSSPDPKRKRI